MKASVDRDACVGCGLCESVCPEVFEMDADSIAVVLVDPVPPEFEECTKQSEDECPVDAITTE